MPAVSLYDTGVWLALAFSSHPFHAKASEVKDLRTEVPKD
jgi:hypothetical protein